MNEGRLLDMYNLFGSSGVCALARGDFTFFAQIFFGSDTSSSMTQRKTMLPLLSVRVAILIGHAHQYMGEIAYITKFEEI